MIRQSLKVDAGLPNAAGTVEKVRLDEINERHGLCRIVLEIGQEFPPTPVQFYRVGPQGGRWSGLNTSVGNHGYKKRVDCFRRRQSRQKEKQCDKGQYNDERTSNPRHPPISGSGLLRPITFIPVRVEF